ncbi:cytotoxic and regulatory T-cell molecule isoform X2 [Sphaeramia orbicularis]|uniref:cytotoxic and regulatory T-cell molecule isoform X2 n=1 Tax=Sphaeramia orbicularis TaxID=375764 RepID=UPI00117F6D2B|nr:cytotoxic and regulatory T-cell molecule isoform X2 [Sphaeramia orbicularis]
MELKLQLSVLMCLVQASLAEWQHVTVMKGHTLYLTCPLKGPLQDPVEWKNPDGNVMFFNTVQGVGDKRYSIIKLSESEFTISVSSVTFTDGGDYICTHYHPQAAQKVVQVTVLDHPKMEVAKHGGKFIVKCTAEANHHAPQLSWMLQNGPEFHGHAQVTRGDKTYVSTEVLYVHSVKTRVTLKCIARHQALHSKPLMNFVRIGEKTLVPHLITTTSSPTAPTQGSTEVTIMMTHGKTTLQITTVGVNGHTTETPSARSPSGTAAHVSTADSSTSVSPVSTSTWNHTDNNETSTAGWTSVSMTTQEIISLNSTEGNNTEIRNYQDGESKGNSSLLVFLVTCLIVGLLVVVIFIGIKLRRAHIAWKKENDDSDPSEVSNKSKSSQEERNAQAQRRRGIFNTAFTQYVVEEPTVITSVTNTAAMTTTEVVNTEQPSQPPRPAQSVDKSIVKETEL